MPIKRFFRLLCVSLGFGFFFTGCNLPAYAPESIPMDITAAGSPVTGTLPVIPTDTAESPSNGAQVNILNLADGDSVEGTLDKEGKALVVIQVEVTGVAPFDIRLMANGIETASFVENPEDRVPFTGELKWSPLSGGGEYDLVIRVLFPDKTMIEKTLHVTVTGIPAFTPTPPPLSREAAQGRISELIQEQFSVSIPKPTVFRFDDPAHPYLSRWIGSAYYKGSMYYLDLYDDAHFAWSGGPYSDPAHRSSQDITYFCRPVGAYSLLIVYVDYGNLVVSKETALAEVPVMVEWLNRLYADFAHGQGYAAPLLQITADAAYIPSPPSVGNLLTAGQILSSTGKDPAQFDLVVEIDLDANTTYGHTQWPGLFTQGGGLALQGCGAYLKDGSHVNIWSAMTRPDEYQGVLNMVLNHELSHLFGLMDNWPFRLGSLTFPDGTSGDDWIPYEMFGWTDTDGDGIPEIIDPTPYGTGGPQP